MWEGWRAEERWPPRNETLPYRALDLGSEML